MPAERLSKVLAAAGVASRRAVDQLIAAGRVTVDGRVAILGERVDPATVVIAVDGRVIDTARPIGVHLACHKPAGVTSTVSDRHADRTVVELVPPELRAARSRLYPVGRLDRDSEGLILLTNDGPWAERVLHPSHGLEREYAVGVRRALDEGQERALRAGIALEEGTATILHLRAATEVETRRLGALVSPAPDPRLAWYRVTLATGWKRQLRRMFGVAGAPIVRLVRVRVGPVRLDGLTTGDCRPLTAAEVRALAASRPPLRPRMERG
jgi:23S rRNA pseudouridine2605 synthase